MRVVSIEIGRHRSVDSYVEPFDPSAVTVLFGPNGAGKTNLLEAVARLVDSLVSPQGLKQSIRFDRLGARGEEKTSYLGSVTVWLDRWREEGHSDQFVLHGLLTDPVIGSALMEGVWEQHQEVIARPLAEMRNEIPSVAVIEQVINFWVDRLTELSASGTASDRRLLASAMFRELRFEFPNGWPCFDNSRFTEEERSAAARINETQAEEWWDDPVAIAASDSVSGMGIVEWSVPDGPPPNIGLGFQYLTFLDRSLGHTRLITGETQGVESHISAVLDELLRSLIQEENRRRTSQQPQEESDPWIDSTGPVPVVHTSMVGWVQRLSRWASDLAPSFVSDQGSVEVEIVPACDQVPVPERVRVFLRESESHRWSLDLLGSGTARWVAISVREALVWLAKDIEADIAAIRYADLNVLFAELEEFTALAKEHPDGRRYGAFVLHHLSARLDALAPGNTNAPVEKDREGTLEESGPAPRWPELESSSALAPLLLIDEPEAHLHPRAIRSVAEWLIAANQRGTGAIVASHSPDFLDLPTAVAELVLVTKDTDGVTNVSRVTDNVLQALEVSTDASGISRGSILQLMRAIVLVEGEHDRLVLENCYGKELAQARVRVLPLRGAYNTLALVEAEFVTRLGIPLILLLDDVRGRYLVSDEVLPRSKTEDLIGELRLLYRRRDAPLRVIPFEEPDVFCALPDDVVARVLKDSHGIEHFPGWQALVRQWKSYPPNFKEFFIRKLDLKVGATKLLRQILWELKGKELHGSGLHKALKQALAEVVAGRRDAQGWVPMS